MEQYLKMLQDNNFVDIPICKIGDIHVEMEFMFLCNHNAIGIVIRESNTYFHLSRNIEPNICGKTFPVTVEGLQEAIDAIDTLKFSKKLNRFYYDEEPPTFDSLFIGKNYKTTYEDCCVCLEKTKRKTICKHALCLPCKNKLSKPLCPLCRECIIEEDDE